MLVYGIPMLGEYGGVMEYLALGIMHLEYRAGVSCRSFNDLRLSGFVPIRLERGEGQMVAQWNWFR